MSNKKSNDATLQTTQQMLDELDALMDKMLSLPVNDPEDAPPFPQEVVKAPTPSPTLSATLTLLEPPPRKPVSPPAIESPVLTESHPWLNPPHMELPSAPAYDFTVRPEPLTNEVMPPSEMQNLEPLLAEIPESEAAVTTEWGYAPLLAINKAFDGATLLLGSAGAWLRGQAGRTLLGLSGIALIVVAAAWFIKDWLGWN